LKGFLLGFATASGLAAFAWWTWGRPVPEPAAPAPAVVATAPEQEAPAKAKRRGRRGRRILLEGDSPADGDRPAAERVDDRGISDDLTPGAVELDLGAEGGERPISNDDVERTIGRGWSRIQRCILLDAAERTTPAKGTVRLGIRIRPNGSVAAVTATPPAELRGGSLVPCLRTTVSGMRFPAFQGREAVVNYPIRIE